VASKRANQELPVIARFEVCRRNYLAPDGSINRPLPAFAADANLLAALYRSMVLLRLFDRKAVALQRTGRLGTYALSLGQLAWQRRDSNPSARSSLWDFFIPRSHCNRRNNLFPIAFSR
jgi:hypothetical protein